MNKILFLILFLWPMISNAQESRQWYVSPEGNDALPGTSDLPFRTLQKAADVVSPGDEVIVRSGTYASKGYQLVEFRKGGSPGKYITFRSEEKYGAVLTGMGKGSYGLIISNGASYLRFIDFEIRDFIWIAILTNEEKLRSNHITVEGNKIHDIGRESDSSGNGKCAVYIRAKNHHWNITRNLIYNIGRTGPEIWWNKDHAVYTGYAESQEEAGHDNRITYNIIFGCSGQALQLSSCDDLVANNVFAWTNENSKSGACFISVGHTNHGLILANNIFYQPPADNAYAIGTTYGCHQWRISHNMVYGGRMFIPEGAGEETTSAMKGGNFCQIDCRSGEVNPMFKDAHRSEAPEVDFSLRPGSPAINAGEDVGLTRDFFDHPIIGKPDIGAIEYIGHQKTSSEKK